ncbi:MAG: glycerol dehydrogenase [Candidatus Obscuribacterales bacterium]|jgi:glycerol dehydrogenase|nr:glycerol dehydrogenase [Candidatus Obscuribacterales bacterium]
MLSTFCAPSRYVQGRNATQQLGTEMKKIGLAGPVFIIAGSHAAELLSQDWKRSFDEVGFKFEVLKFGGECSLNEIHRCKEAASKFGAKTIVGAGGGKVLDTARAVAAEINAGIVNCPTLASSDAPCSALSVVYTDEGQFAEYKFYPRNPELVLVDSSIVAKGPARLLVAGMGDALATWFEAKTVVEAKKRNQVGGATTLAGEALAALCYETLLEDGVAALHAVRSQVVTPALERLIEANTLLSGLGFESGGLAVAHSVHNGLTTVHETHNYYHGEKVAFGLLVQLVLEGKTSSVINEVIDFSMSVGLPICLRDLGIYNPSKALCMQIAERATAPGETAHNEPFSVTADMVADAIQVADSIGREYKIEEEEGAKELCMALS